MRRLLAFVLLAVFGLPVVSPLLAIGQTSESRLPACCRRSGKHHCSMTAAQAVDSAGLQPRFQATPGKCPCCPAATLTGTGTLATARPPQGFYALMQSHPSAAAQTECRWRISRDRSRQKRGPPYPRNSLESLRGQA